MTHILKRHTPEDAVKAAIVRMEPMANELAGNLIGFSVAEIATIMAYTLLTLERAVREKGLLLPRHKTFQLVDAAAKAIAASQAIDHTAMPSETKN